MSTWAILTRYPLAKQGTLVMPEVREMLTSEYLEALKVDVPALNHLEASALAVAEEVADQQLWLVVLLVPATTLFRQGVPPGGPGSNSAYARELQLVRAQIESVGLRMVEARGEGRSPLDGVRDDKDVSSTRAVRARMRKHRKKGKAFLPALPYSREVDVGALPLTLPRGPSIRIVAHVMCLEPAQARLTSVRFDGSDYQRLKHIPDLGECSALRRGDCADYLRWGHVLRHAMDTHSEIALDVVVELCWFTGRALRFDLRGCEPPVGLAPDWPLPRA